MKQEWIDLLRTAIVGWFPRALIALAIASMLAVVWLRIRHSRSSRCPGGPTPISWHRPRTWFRRSACGYDLTGLPAADGGSVRCPECGARVRPGTRLWFRSAWRFEVIACLCVAVAGLCRWAPHVRGGRWLAKMPTWALLTLEARHPSVWSHHARSALTHRLNRQELSQDSVDRLCEVAIAHLGEDDIPGNGEWAMQALANIGDAAMPALEAALDSTDWQRRQMAAFLLRGECFEYVSVDGRTRPRLRREPSDRLIEVTVEGLRDDNLPYDRRRGRETFLSNGFNGMAFLVCVGPRAVPACERALNSDDPQQRLLAAAALGMMGAAASIDRAAPVLINHLAGNAVPGDANLAAAALLGFGPAALVHLEQCAKSSDAQARRIGSSLSAWLRGTPLSGDQTAMLRSISGAPQIPDASVHMPEWNREAARWGRRITLAWPVSPPPGKP